MPRLTKEEDAHKRMFIGKLNPNTDDSALRNYFGSYGDIDDYIIMRYPDTKRSKCFGFVTFHEIRSLEQVLETQPHFIEGAQVELKRAVPREEMGGGHDGPKHRSAGGGSMVGRLFVGRLNYDTNDTVLRAYFERFGELTDNVIMRYPDTKRSKGFGFVTFKDAKCLEDCINSQPHVIDGKEVELQRATPKEGGREVGPMKGGYRGHGGRDEAPQEDLDPEHKLLRTLVIGNLNYATPETELQEYFERYGKLEAGSLMKFNDTGRSRGFAFLT
jgi:RNA recognition motif-containing protein